MSVPESPIRHFTQGGRPAVVLTVDDIFPGLPGKPFEAGGALERGVLGRLNWLLRRHPQLRITLFVTPDWRETSPKPTSWLRFVPWLREHVYLAPILPQGTMELGEHPEFCAYLRAMPRTEIALHGLHHIHRGPHIATEFQHQNKAKCLWMLRHAIEIFEEAGLPYTPGLQPPGWNLPHALRQACVAVGLRYVASGRDLRTRISTDALVSHGYGLSDTSLIFPQRTPEGLLHFPTNFQATCAPERAFEILDHGGLLSIKAHATRYVPGHVHRDGVDRLYMNYLDLLFSMIEERYGNDVVWTTLNDITDWVDAQQRAAPQGETRRVAAA